MFSSSKGKLIFSVIIIFAFITLKRTSALESIDSMENSQFLIIGGIIVIAIAAAIISHIQAKKRREALAALAQQLGFSFSPDKNRQIASKYGFLDHMDDGQNRYAYNILSGQSPDGSTCQIFDYHYETKSRDSDGKTKTHHHYRSIFVLTLPKQFPELNIKPEGFFSKIAQSIGFDDIDFESHKFSKRYEVKSKDKKFAYDFCNAQMIDYLLKQPNYIIEVDSNVLALTFKGKLNISQITPNYQSLLEIRTRIPEYLFAQ